MLTDTHDLDCADTLHNQTHTKDIVAIASLFEAFSFDMLQAMVREMNDFSETPQEVMKWLNIKLHITRKEDFIVQKLIVNGKDHTKHSRGLLWAGNPVTDKLVAISFFEDRFSWFRSSSHHKEVMFSPQNHLKSGNLTTGEFIFEDETRNSQVVLQRSRAVNLFEMTKVLGH